MCGVCRCWLNLYRLSHRNKSTQAFRHMLLTPWMLHTYSHRLKQHGEGKWRGEKKKCITHNSNTIPPSTSSANVILIVFFGVFFISLFPLSLCWEENERMELKFKEKKRNTDFRYSYIINLHRILHIFTTFFSVLFIYRPVFGSMSVVGCFFLSRYSPFSFPQQKVLICICVVCYVL